jgi:hypothetical protein
MSKVFSAGEVNVTYTGSDRIKERGSSQSGKEWMGMGCPAFEKINASGPVGGAYNPAKMT